MSGVRNSVFDETGMGRRMQSGDSMIMGTKPTIISADAVDTLTVAKIVGGAVIYTGFTAGRNLTTDTAANILAAFPSLDIGEAVYFEVGITVAFAGTFVAGVGVTLKGRATCPASTHVHCYIVKTSSTTVDFVVV